jgi:hypothetical protein
MAIFLMKSTKARFCLMKYDKYPLSLLKQVARNVTASMRVIAILEWNRLKV